MLRHGALERSLIAYTVGAAVGGFGYGVEAVARDSAFTWTGLALYTLLGGVVAAVSRSLAAALLPTVASRLAFAVVLSGFAALHLLYFANVNVLAGEHFLSTTSLVVDLLVLLAVAVPALLLARSHRAHAVRLRVGRTAAALGVALLLAALIVLAYKWPAAPDHPSRDGRGPDLVLVVMDSVRRDRVGAAEAVHRATPALSAMSREGRAYSQAFSASSWTVPSVARLLGTERAASPSLADRLARQGYVTACFTDNPHLWSGSSIMRGFDRVQGSVGRWRVILHGTILADIIERLLPGGDRQLVDRAIEWADEQRGPFFLYVHLMDSHTPYKSKPIDGKQRPGRRIEFPGTGMHITPFEAEDIIARYEGGVLSADLQAARLVSGIRAHNRPYLIAVTADHGESLGESGRWFHGHSLAPELLAVPLLVLGEGVATGRVDSPVSNTMLRPTLLAAAEIPCGECGHEDLRTGQPSTVVEGGLPPELAYRVAGRYKLVVNLKTGAQQLFDRAADRAEERDIASDRTDIVQTLGAGIAGLTYPQPTPESIERLRSLGYTTSGVDRAGAPH